MNEQSKKNKVWYHEGLCFKCTGCGKCCTGAPGYVWISEDEIENVSSFLDLPRDIFISQYLRRVNGKLCLKEFSKTYDCVFFKNKRCTIYSVRPTQCRTYPWWPQNLSSPEAWREEAQRCEGISPYAPKIPITTIEESLKEQELWKKEIFSLSNS